MTRGAALAWLAAALLACSASALGSEALFNDYYTQLRLQEQRTLLFHSLHQWALVLNVVAALTLLALRRVQTDIAHFPWLLGASLAGNGYFLAALGIAPAESLLVDVLVTAWLYCLSRILYPTPSAFFQRLLGALPLAALLAYGVAATFALPTLHSLVTAACALALWLSSSRQLGPPVQGGTPSQRSLALGVWLIALCLLVDTLLLLADVHLPAHPDRVLQSVPLGQMAGVLLALYFLVASYGTTLRQLASLNASLDQRVQQAEAEFADRYAMLTRDALDAAALRERKNIYHSIHEDLSDKLLQLIYSATKPDTADLARSALAELRDSRKLHPDQSHVLTDILADAYAEAQTRCDQAGLTLDWQVDDALQHWTLSARQESALTRTLREALSNLLKHAQASNVSVQFMAQNSQNGYSLAYGIADNGRGISATHRPGRGLVNMRNRLQELGGSVTIAAGENEGTHVHFLLPVSVGKEARS